MDKLKFAESIAYSSKETLNFTYECAVKLKDIEGDFVECGVAAGAQIIAMGVGAPNKAIHAFDSFEGIPLPSNKDDQMPGIKFLTKEEIKNLPNPGEQELKSSGATVVGLDSFLSNVKGINVQRLVIHKGWFEETVPNNRIEKISLLRLDGDLYNSTIVCLEGLFKKVVKGGIVIIDDWQLAGCQQACKDYFKKIKYKPDYQFISNIAYFIK